MSWFKVDDGFSDHPKVRSIPRAQRAAAIGLWTLAGSWSAKNLTDGFVPDYMLAELGCTRGQAAALVQAGLWRRADGGYAFHEWDDHQPSREQVKERRAKTAERVARWRATKVSASQGHVSVGNGVTNSVTNVVSNAAPDPTRPDPYQEEQETPSPEPATLVLVTADAVTARPKRPSFDDFWAPYPRKVGKDDARKAWDKATKIRKVDPGVIVAGAKRFAADPNLPAKQFIPHPSTWLARGGWQDEPCPATGTSGRFTNPGIPEGW
jgi:hypothetical protein